MRLPMALAGMTVTLIACAAPRDLSNVQPLPLTSGPSIQNTHAVTEISDTPEVLQILAQTDRASADRALDGPRQSADMLTYLDVSPGMRIAELAAGGGYMTDLLVRSLGSSGVLYATNPPSLVRNAGIADAWNTRLATMPRNRARVVRVDRELDAPLPMDARGLDLVYLAYSYGDLAQSTDQPALVTTVFDALRPGGRFVVIDCTPRGGATSQDLRVLHVEASRNARYEIERAGFRFVSEGRFLRRSSDPRDWSNIPTAGAPIITTDDRFLLTFMKP